MIKKHLLVFAFAVFALNCAFAQPYAAKEMGYVYQNAQNDIKNLKGNDAGSFFLADKLGKTNLNNKLQNAYYLSLNNAAASRACDNVKAEDVEKVLISKIKSFNLQEEYKKVKPDTKIEKINYAKIRPHVHKRKLLSAIRSEIKAGDEVKAKKDILTQIYNNLRAIAGQAVISSDTQYKRNLLCVVNDALGSVKRAQYMSALEITKQAVNK